MIYALTCRCLLWSLNSGNDDSTNNDSTTAVIFEPICRNLRSDAFEILQPPPSIYESIKLTMTIRV